MCSHLSPTTYNIKLFSFFLRAKLAEIIMQHTPWMDDSDDEGVHTGRGQAPTQPAPAQSTSPRVKEENSQTIEDLVVYIN